MKDAPNDTTPETPTDEKAKYLTLTIEAAKQGWIIRQKGKPAEVFVRWENAVLYLAANLTSK